MQLCVKQVSPLGVCMFSDTVSYFLCTDVCWSRSGKGYSNKCGLFDPAALKHVAPPTLVLSCVPTSVRWLKYHSSPHKHLL